MTRPSLGITAMELFACNPFRVLGIAVDTPTADVTLTYKKLLDMAAKGDTADYETPYDCDFLPPFSRSEKDLKTAYAKIASNGYRCFAFSDPIFSASLNIDDVMLNLRDISCYDCFLRCYMWLITNDRDFEEPELWIPLCQYIDKMIMSSPEQWDKYFDHRFPQDMLDSSMSALRSFYATFCDIILLPIKEMVRGSMKCRSAMEILKIAKVDVDEVFPDIDIPQANLPKRGEPAPKLKIAVKDGEEYYLGVFLVGAYQETLGDLHNLMGDTNVVSIRVDPDGGYEYVREIRGDSVADILSYVEYDPRRILDDLRATAERAVRAGRLTPSDRFAVLQAFEDGLRGYTYFER